MHHILRGAKCIVLGANGYIGRHLVRYLSVIGCSVQAVDTHDRSIVPSVSYICADIGNAKSLQSIDWNVSYVFMFAGLTGTLVGFDNYEQFVNVNELGLLNILTILRNSVIRPQIIFPSTRLVYEGSEVPLVENAQKNPKTIYAINKLTCEHILESYRVTFEIPYTVYRICVPYGDAFSSGYSYGLTGLLLKQAQEKKLITLYGDGLLRRTLTHVEDICMHIVEGSADTRCLNGTFNIPGEPYSLCKIAELIAERFGAQVRYLEWPPRDLKIESGHTVFAGDKLESIVSRRLAYSFEDWIKAL